MERMKSNGAAHLGTEGEVHVAVAKLHSRHNSTNHELA